MCLAGMLWLSSLSSTLLPTFKLLALKVILELCVTAVMRRGLRRRPTISPLMNHREREGGGKSSPNFSRFFLLFLTISPQVFTTSSLLLSLLYFRSLYPSRPWSSHSSFTVRLLNQTDIKQKHTYDCFFLLGSTNYYYYYKEKLMELVSLSGLSK